MNLQEVFDQLTYGELSQLSIGGGEAGAIDEDNYIRVIPHINLALTTLYKRFNLKQSRINFILQPNGYAYALHVDDLFKVESVLTDTGYALGLNDESDKYSCFTTGLKTLTVAKDIVDKATDLPDYLKTVSIDVTYRANHPKITMVTVANAAFDPTIIELELPETHLEPLLLFIAARILAPTGVGQFEGLASNGFMVKYEAACQQLVIAGLQVSSSNTNTRLHSKGWA